MKKSKSKSKKTASKQPYSKLLFILFFLAVLTLAIFIVRPFLSTLIVSAIVAYIFYPVYKYFSRVTNMKGFSAAVLIILLLLVSTVPLVIVTGKLSKESYDAYLKVKKVFLDAGSFEEACTGGGGFICSIYTSSNSLSERYDLNLGFHFAQGFSSIASKVISGVSNFILEIPKILLHFLISIFAMYYMFISGDKMIASLKNMLPLRDKDSDRIMEHFNDIIHATVYGAIVIAIIQGVVAGIGYFIFGVTSPILLALLTIVAAFIPFLGAALVWLPVSISMLINGMVTDSNTLMLKAGGLVIWGVFVSIIDNVLRPKIVGDRANVHPLVILLGVFGGLALFGFVGIMIGPLLLTLFIASLRIYEEEKHHIL
ncbi:AI-2E family transporter [Candidatus Woesearchaeota archaeon]|jgi:predicted PurR-regulated permease PerM|nr:AI-2E family transporter [Candidatus Woesearchaeota archaeon]